VITICCWHAYHHYYKSISYLFWTIMRSAIVDDVVTTGATVRSCSQEILNSGAKEVRVLSLARTVNDWTSCIKN
ncbi:hypothetical protein OZD66_04875, partial [Wolbachia endosymbiont of Drosophila baimaii]|uniref:ComF family protein n=1 Tax=Wolbachia endosymbiont of Drosophila baimaii TaxID=375917 RepID=UPI00397C5F1C|nr:hypothetical protein [Wolbachia endosymbiont of Drosophila baimaii]